MSQINCVIEHKYCAIEKKYCAIEYKYSAIEPKYCALNQEVDILRVLLLITGFFTQHQQVRVERERKRTEGRGVPVENNDVNLWEENEHEVIERVQERDDTDQNDFDFAMDTVQNHEESKRQEIVAEH